jgi:hypothetical protein
LRDDNCVTVRREKALDFGECNSRLGTGSLHPVTIEAAEATKLSVQQAEVHQVIKCPH